MLARVKWDQQQPPKPDVDAVFARLGVLKYGLIRDWLVLSLQLKRILPTLVGLTDQVQIQHSSKLLKIMEVDA